MQGCFYYLSIKRTVSNLTSFAAGARRRDGDFRPRLRRVRRVFVARHAMESLPSPRGRRRREVTLHDSGAHRGGGVRDRAGAGRHEDRAVTGGGTDVLHGVKVLGHHHHLHDVLGGDVGDVLLEVHHALPQAVDDRLPLTRDTGTRQVLGLRVRLCRLDDHDLLSLGAVLRGDAGALRGVDLVHRRLHLVIGRDVGDERLDDGVAELGHGLLEHVLDLDGDLFLGGEDVVQVDPGHRRADDVEDVGSDLLPGIGELVEGVVHAGGLAEDHVLGGHDDCDEDVVLGLGLDGDVEGLDAGGERARHVLAEARNHPVATRIGELLELASLLDDLDGALGDACPAH
mmetsp:Transcript_9302/g.36168  ORF Transcript_9302/g.36168 Transcript_9302/m.36168 type:complete len:342 (-) Transcript_9302:144-1169(-)